MPRRQPAVSKQVAVLKLAGLLRDHEGRQTHYNPQFGGLAPLLDGTSQMAGWRQRRFERIKT